MKRFLKKSFTLSERSTSKGFTLSERSESKGFSLLEMVVYVAILSGIAILVVGSMLQLARSWNSVMLTQDINASAQTALERMVREIRLASSVDTGASTLGSHPGVLKLNTTDSEGAATTVTFQLDGSVLDVLEGGAAAGTLTHPDVVVSNLVFRRAASANSAVVNIDMELTASRGSIEKVIPFHASAVLRGAY